MIMIILNKIIYLMKVSIYKKNRKEILLLEQLMEQSF